MRHGIENHAKALRTSASPFRRFLETSTHRNVRPVDALYILAGGSMSFLMIFVIIGAIELLYLIPSSIAGGHAPPVLFLLFHGGMFFLLPMLFIWPVYKRNRKLLTLVRSGRISRATVRKGQATGLVVNGRRELEYILTFKDADGNQRTAVDKTYKHHQVTDEKNEQILYDPKDTENAMLVDGLVQKLRINERDEEVLVGGVLGFLSLIPAAIFGLIVALAPLHWLNLLLDGSLRRGVLSILGLS